MSRWISQFSSVAQSCQTLCNPMNHSTPGLHHQLPEFTQTHVHWVSDAIQPSHPLWSASPPALNLSQHQFSSVQLLSHVRLFATPLTAACQASLSITNSQSPPQIMSIELVMPSNHLILCCPLLLLPSIFPSIRVFSNESALHIRWPKYWSFSFNISSSNEHPGLISFRMDWLDLLAVQGTLKSLLQHHSSKASILRHSAFFIVQPSPPYMTTGKTIALTRWIFVGKVMSLLFNMLSRWTYLLRNLYAGQEATVRIGHGTTDWFQIEKGVRQGCILSPCLFNLYRVTWYIYTYIMIHIYIMRKAGLEEAQSGIKISGRNIINLRYADDTTLMAESEEELKSLLMKVKEESEKVGLRSWHLVPSLHGK